MPKKSCCCAVNGNYIAIPCRYSSVASFNEGIAKWAHWASGAPSPYSDQGYKADLRGPFRYVNGELVFDSTRDILYMLRGAGAGAANRLTYENYKAGRGGHGAYIEYKKNANINDVVKSGAGGCGGTYNLRYDAIPANYQNGGEAFYVSGDGGGGSVVGTDWTWYQSPAAVAAGGGGGGFYWIPYNIQNRDQVLPYIGGKYGGNGGITFGKDGEAGIYWSEFTQNPEPPGLCGAGGGGTQTRGGCGGGGQITAIAADGTKLSGGKGSIRIGSGNSPTVGYGGGGGGGFYGGGGGARDGGGGGGSSTIVSNRSKYAFESKNDVTANYCNPYMFSTTGLGGKSTLNPYMEGRNGEVVQYYIYGECDCDSKKNSIPDPPFICLNDNQYQSVIDALGPSPTGGSFYIARTPLFSVNGEEYILLGKCTQSCEDVYKLPSGLTITDARWVVDSNVAGGGGFDYLSNEGPPCCSQIVCRPICPVSGANCATCGCDQFSQIYTCCKTKGKPDAYTAVYNGWVYSCTKSNNNWIIPGKETETVTKLCLEPFTGTAPGCNAGPTDCQKTVSDPAPCTPRNSQNCGDLSVSVLGPTVWYFRGSNACPGAIQNDYSFTIQGSISLTPGTFSGSINIVPNNGDPCWSIPGGIGFYTLTTSFQYIETNVIENVPILKIEFDCIPSNLGSQSGIPFNLFTGIWQICDATVNATGGAYLSTIVNTFNSLLGGRVILTDLTNGIYHTSFNDHSGDISVSINNGRATYTSYAKRPLMKPCGSVVYYLSSDLARDPISHLPRATVARRSLYVGGEVSAWDPLTSLGFTNCICSMVNDCPTYSGCAPCVEDGYIDGEFCNPYTDAVTVCGDLIVS